MNPTIRHAVFAIISLLVIRVTSLVAALPDLGKITTAADLDALVASTGDAALKQVLRENAAAILAAAAQRPHIDPILRAIEISPGKVGKINTTPDSLKNAAGGDIALFDTLNAVDLAIPNAGPHDHRKTDPYDAAFFEHLGHITALESLNIIATKANDEWIKPLGRLTNLKTLRFTNNGKLTDAGMEHLAGLKNLETFSFVGTGITGRAYAKCEDWTRVTKVSHRGSSIDDEGLQQLCEHLPNLESISLAHAKFTDAGAPNLAKLTKLKGLEIGTSKATPQTLTHLAKLPLEYLQLGEGFESPECIPLIKGLATLRRLTLNNAKGFTDSDLKLVATLTQVEHLELGKIDLSDERLATLKEFAILKSMRLVPVKEPFTPEMQAKVKAALPKTELQFK
jgi:hypothetical protein